MIVDLPDTTVSKISRALIDVREEGGAVALGRVLTLIIVTTNGGTEDGIEAANDASREHPMRVISLRLDPEGEPKLDAEIRVGGDAGASEVVVLRASGDAASNVESLVTGLLLPDAPVVVWWPDNPPATPSQSPLGRIAQRRITDASTVPFEATRVAHLGDCYSPGDTDLAWTRLTHWREQLAAVLDQPPYEPITAVEVRGAETSPVGCVAAPDSRCAGGLALPLPRRMERRHQVGPPHACQRRHRSGTFEHRDRLPDAARTAAA